MTDRQFTYFSYFEKVYVKPVIIDGAVLYAVHAADGTLLFRLSDHEAARTAARQCQVEPVSVH